MSTFESRAQPRPLRLIAAVGALVSLIVGAASAVAVAFIGETQVTPLTSPRAADGTPLVRAAGPTTLVDPGAPPAG